MFSHLSGVNCAKCINPVHIEKIISLPAVIFFEKHMGAGKAILYMDLADNQIIFAKRFFPEPKAVFIVIDRKYP